MRIIVWLLLCWWTISGLCHGKCIEWQQNILLKNAGLHIAYSFKELFYSGQKILSLFTDFTSSWQHIKFLFSAYHCNNVSVFRVKSRTIIKYYDSWWSHWLRFKYIRTIIRIITRNVNPYISQEMEAPHQLQILLEKLYYMTILLKFRKVINDCKH